MTARGRARRLVGVLSVLGWIALCAVLVSVQVTRPLGGAFASGAVGGPALVGAQGLSVEPASWVVGVSGGSVSVTVASQRTWRALSDQGWLSITSVEGRLVLTAEANAGLMRTASVMVTSGREAVVVAVAQEGHGVTVGNPTQTAAPTPSPTPTVSPTIRPTVDPDGFDRALVQGAMRLVPGDTPKLTGYFFYPPNPSLVLNYQVAGIYRLDNISQQIVIGQGPANLPEPGVGNHGYSQNLPTSYPANAAVPNLLGACVYYFTPAGGQNFYGCDFFGA